MAKMPNVEKAMKHEPHRPERLTGGKVFKGQGKSPVKIGSAGNNKGKGK